MAHTAERPAALGARMGLYAGLTCLVFFITLYMVSPVYLISPVILFGFVIVVLFKVAASYFFWKDRKGEVEFKDALQSVFLVSVISLGMLVFFFYLLFNFIDSSLAEQIKNNIHQSAMKAFDEERITKEQLNAALKKADNFKLGAGSFFAMYSFTLFIGFFYALVFAAITKLIGRNIAATPEIHN